MHKAGKTGAVQLLERLKSRYTEDLMSRIEAKLIGLRMLRHIKINLETVGNISIEGSAKHNSFMNPVIKSCRMVGIKVDSWLHSLLDGIKKVATGEDLTHLLLCYCTQ